MIDLEKEPNTGRPRRWKNRREKTWFTRFLVLLSAGLLAVGLGACGEREEMAESGEQSMSVQESQQNSESSQPSSAAEASSPAGEGAPASTAQASQVGEEASTSQEGAEPVSAAGGDWRLVLVNAKNKLDGDYEVELQAIGDYKVDARVADDLNAMLAAAKADGYTLKIYSAYRSTARSGELYRNKVQEYVNSGYSRTEAEKEAAKWIAPPGTSEHNTGLSVDLISGDYFSKFPDLVHEFDTTEEFAWLDTHCTEYGFILRYPKDKQEVTGITYEPWHYRYVGKELAREITDSKLCLEEFVAAR